MTISPTLSAISRCKAIFFCSAMGETILCIFSREPRSSKEAQASSSWPASILEMSRTSLIRASRWRELFCTMLICLCCSSLRGPASPCSMMPVKPMIELSGVRSSWDMVARKADLIRSASRAFSSATRSCSSAWRSSVISAMIATAPCWGFLLSKARQLIRAQKSEPSRRISCWLR
ncbi:MAG: hypothetical protein ACD_75C01885G0001 [uncultured bacterium]|nr:MAG: hypothetical protein ACD_75C01885G0001 [uncultured bacterium]